MAEPKDFLLEYAKSGRSKCKRSKAPIEKGELRVGQSKPSIYGEEGDLMWVWYKVGPFFDMMMKMKKSTKKPETVEDFGGFEELEEVDQERIRTQLREHYDRSVTITAAPKKKRPAAKKKPKDEEDEVDGEGDDAAATGEDEDEDSKPAKKKAKAAASPKKAKCE
jgi:hypothetical protein